MQDHAIDPTALRQLTNAVGIPPDANLIEATQKEWLRRPGQERWELTEISPEKKAFVLNWAKEQGLLDAWKPAAQEYDTALILGATTGRMQMRLDHLKELWAQGIRFKEIVWLTGDRPLDERIDGFIDRCTNESEAAHILWEEIELPSEMRALPVVFIAVPLINYVKSVKRPTTQDTLIAWLNTHPSPETKALFVSDQPFCGYQFAVVKSCLPSSMSFDLVGPEADPTSHPAAAAIILDSIARWLYQENIIKRTAPTTFYLVRHGQTNWNVDNKLQGHTDIPLNETGREQAYELRRQFERVPFELCFTSDLQRALETAEILSTPHEVKVVIDPRLRERSFGAWEGRLVSELKTAPTQPTCVETYEAVQDRVLPFFQEIANLHPGATILVVAHGGVMRAILGKLAAPQCTSLIDIQIENLAHFQMKALGDRYEIQSMEGIQIP